jgi:hypothetical protein
MKNEVRNAMCNTVSSVRVTKARPAQPSPPAQPAPLSFHVLSPSHHGVGLGDAAGLSTGMMR